MMFLHVILSLSYVHLIWSRTNDQFPSHRRDLRGETGRKSMDVGGGGGDWSYIRDRIK